jgi:hypothetical protein
VTPSIRPTWLTIGFFPGWRAAVFAGSSWRQAEALTILCIDFTEEKIGPALAGLDSEVWSRD